MTAENESETAQKEEVFSYLKILHQQGLRKTTKASRF
jgi:hypothetical protein